MNALSKTNEFSNNVNLEFQLIKNILLLAKEKYNLSFLNFDESDIEDIGLDVIENKNVNKKPLGDVKKTDNAVSDGTNKELDAAEIWASISDKEKEAVKGKNLLEIDSVTKMPKYKVAKGSKDNKYHIYDEYGKCVVDVEQGNNYLMHNYSSKNKYKKVGGETESYIAGQIMQGGDFVQGTIADIDVKKGGFYLLEDAETQSPLIIDFDGDGKVSAQAGIGIDINGDGIADGAATNGDKMLAMSDINGNGKIDGAEVFGNKTVNPFTGEAINAKNGFEALKEVALYAELYSGTSCIEDGNVNLKNLQKVLEKKGIRLGFVSDTNNTTIEKLSKIEKINVDNYEETPEYGLVQHNQRGSGTNSDGTNVKVDDVWFRTGRYGIL